MGMITLMKGFGVDLKVRRHIDSSAAKGILEWVGSHKARHLDVDVLWMPNHVARDTLQLDKVSRTWQT